MSYVKQTWVDRAVEFFRRFSVSEDASGNLTLTEEPGIVTSAGTPLDATRLNHIEEGIYDAHENAGDRQYTEENYVVSGETITESVNKLDTNLNLVQLNKIDKQENNWITPVLENGWVNFGSGYAEAKYMKDNLGFVHLRGMVKSGNTVAPIFTLPVGFRPSATLNFVVASNALAKYLRVFANGTIVSQSATNEWIDLSGISFWPDS